LKREPNTEFEPIDIFESASFDLDAILQPKSQVIYETPCKNRVFIVKMLEPWWLTIQKNQLYKEKSC